MSTGHAHALTRAGCSPSLSDLQHLAQLLRYFAGRGIRWDPAKETVIGDDAAMGIGSYRREYRASWKLPKYTV